jgi:DNA polymerase IV
MAERRVIAHIDLDAFFVSAELKRHPQLKGKPVIVAHNGPRSIVTTASYEARKFGIHSAMAAQTAARLCQEAIFLTPDGAYYREISDQVFQLVREMTKQVEKVSVDEAYLDISAIEAPIKSMRKLVADIQQSLEMDASVGIGPNKLVAKVCSDAEKPKGFVILSAEGARIRFASESPKLLPGIGPKTAERLEKIGVHTIKELQEYSVSKLQEKWGKKQGLYLWQRAMFIDDTLVSEERIVKSKSVERTYPEDLDDQEELEESLREMSEELSKALKKSDQQAKTIGLKIRDAQFKTVTRDYSLLAPSNSSKLISSVAIRLLRQYASPDPLPALRLLGIKASKISDTKDVREESNANAHVKEKLRPQLQLFTD